MSHTLQQVTLSCNTTGDGAGAAGTDTGGVWKGKHGLNFRSWATEGAGGDSGGDGRAAVSLAFRPPAGAHQAGVATAGLDQFAIISG
jgi:hypothetical protein